MLVSILHRITGGALTVVGLAILTWWLLSIAGGPRAYADVSAAGGHWLGRLVLIGLTWAFYQHLLSGVRHLVMDTGRALELQTSKRFSILTIVGSLLLTAATWALLLGDRA